VCLFFFSSRRRHTRCLSDWSSDVCSSDLLDEIAVSRSAAEEIEAEQREEMTVGRIAVGVARGEMRDMDLHPGAGPADAVDFLHEIGRASCRERVEIRGVAGSLRKK